MVTHSILGVEVNTTVWKLQAWEIFGYLKHALKLATIHSFSPETLEKVRVDLPRVLQLGGAC